ncbi:hypothetical protein V502_11411 [Pseudogymnoascus sp. VKM F-4520 (FW-2644)]|nr:hypothetical protein V502_11411 [Pseudogymnoascus sp. VKM F-4520 (FW-2644)]
MEAVGALASIVQLVDATAKLINYLKDVRAAEKQISTVQSEIEIIHNVLVALQTSVDENPKTFHVTLTALNAKDGILFEISSFITDFKEKLEAKPGRKLGRKISWPFDKSRFQQDLERIQRYKTILICALLNDSIILMAKILDGVDTIKHGVEEITHNVDGISTALEQQKKHDTLEWLSPARRFDFSQQQAALTATRAKNTGRWLIESEPFGLWLGGNQDSIILKGGGGVGKTMLASTAIEHLTTFTATRPQRNAIAYVFGNWAHANKFNAQNLLASLLKQLLSVKDGQLPETLEELHSSNTYPTYPQLCRLLQSEVTRFSKTFIIIDALNELDDVTQDQLLRTLTELQTSVTKLQQPGVAIKLMVTTQNPYRILQYNTSAAELDIRARKEDLELWIDESLRALPPGCFVAKSSLETHQNIKATLAKAADGIFLLAKLSMSTISKASNTKKLKQALESISSNNYSLDKAYNDTMERLKAQDGRIQAEWIILLSFITHASRELTVSELEHALAIEVDNISDLREAIDFCSGLVEIDAEDQRVMLARHTTKEYFDRTKETHFPDASAMITQRCLAYLSDAKLTDSCQSYESYEARVASFPFLEYAAQNWGFHASHGEVQRTLSANILAFLRKASNVACSAQALLQSQDHWWYRHSSIKPQMSQGISGLHICAWFGLLYTATQLIEEHANVNIMDYNHRGPLWYAVHNRKKEAVALLLEKGAEISTDGPLLPVFEECVKSSDLEIVKILGGFQDYSADCCSDMLKLAAQNPHCGADMAELVLNSYPSVPIEEIHEGFILSSVSNHLCGKSILSMLINRGWKIPIDLNIIRVLSNDISSGADILKCLLSQGDIKLDASIFELAASGCASDVMEALLDYQPEFKFDVDILPLTAEVNEEMFLTVLKRHPHFEVTQQMLDRLVKISCLRSAAMEALFKHAPPGSLKIDDGIMLSYIRAAYSVSPLIHWLLDHFESSQGEGIPDKILVAAVRCNDAIRMLGVIQLFEPKFRVTSRILKVAVSAHFTESEVLKWLLQHDPDCEVDENLLIEALKIGNDNRIRLLLSHKSLRPTLPMFSACKDLSTLELLVALEESISNPDVVDVVTESALGQGADGECINRVLGHIQNQHVRITSAALKAAAANTFTASALQWVLDHASTLEITPSVFEHAAHGSINLKKMELLAARNPEVNMTEEVLITVCDYGNIKALQWVLDRTDIAHITPRVLAAAARSGRVGKKDSVAYMKLLLARNPSLVVTEEVMNGACRAASRRNNLKPLVWILAEYPRQLLSEVPMAILLSGYQFSTVVEIIKQHIPKLNITPAFLVAAANNRSSVEPLRLLLSFDVKVLLSEAILTDIVRSKMAALKLGDLQMLHPVSIKISDSMLCAASESRHGPGALQWLIEFLEPREPNQAPMSAQEAMMWYLNRDPPPLITQEMVVAIVHEPWGGEVLHLLLKLGPTFTISKEMIEAVCHNWRLGEHHCRLLLNHSKHIRASDEVLYVALKSPAQEAIVIYKLLRDHNEDIDYQ